MHSNDEAGITDEPHLLLERELSKVLHHQLHSWQSAQSRNYVAFIGEDATGVHRRVVAGQPPDDQKDLQSLVRGNQLGVLQKSQRYLSEDQNATRAADQLVVIASELQVPPLEQ